MKSAHPIELALVVGLAVLDAVCVLVVAAVALVIELAAAMRRRRRPVRPVSPVLAPVAAAAPQAPPVAAVAVPGAASLAAIADDLRRLPAARLRELAGTRRRCSKDRLIADLLAIPV
jgi:hypothetical protein